MSSTLFLMALLAAGDAPAAEIYKWKDSQGNLFVTDRLGDVPAELRPKLRKRAEEAAKAKKKKPPADPQKIAVQEPSAYEKLKRRERKESELKTQGLELRQTIAATRSKQAQLAEERGYLASNPLLNASQPGRVQRMNDIAAETKALDAQRATALDTIKDLLREAQNEDLPEEWVTGE